MKGLKDIWGCQGHPSKKLFVALWPEHSAEMLKSPAMPCCWCAAVLAHHRAFHAVPGKLSETLCKGHRWCHLKNRFIANKEMVTEIRCLSYSFTCHQSFAL